MTTRFGSGFWDLIPFTIQMARIIVGGYVVGSLPPVWRLIDWLASVPSGGRGGPSRAGQHSGTRDLVVSNLNTYNFLFLMLGMLLHWRPRRFLQAVARSVPAVAGVLQPPDGAARISPVS